MNLHEMLDLAIAKGGVLTIDFTEATSKNDMLVKVTEPKSNTTISRVVDKDTGEVNNTDYSKNFGSLEQKGAVPQESFADFLGRVEESGVEAVLQTGEEELSFVEVVDRYKIGVDSEKAKTPDDYEVSVHELPESYQNVITEVFGYGLDEVRAFRKGLDLQITDLQGNDITEPRGVTKPKSKAETFLDWFTLETFEALKPQLKNSEGTWCPWTMKELLLIQWYTTTSDRTNLESLWVELFDEWTTDWIVATTNVVTESLQRNTSLPTRLLNDIRDTLEYILTALSAESGSDNSFVYQELDQCLADYISGKSALAFLAQVTSLNDFAVLEKRAVQPKLTIGLEGDLWIKQVITTMVDSLNELITIVCVESGAENQIEEAVILDMLSEGNDKLVEEVLYPIVHRIVQDKLGDKEFMKPALARAEDMVAGEFITVNEPAPEPTTEPTTEPDLEPEPDTGEESVSSTGDLLGIVLRDTAVVTAYKQGQTIAEIKKCYNLSSGAVYSILNKAGVQRKNSGTSKVATRVNHVESNKSQLAQLFEDYEDGELTLSAIYEKYAIYKNGLYYLLDKYNIPRRS